jgi:threonylcarbamoyladenosine tRNA methylthiotransferase MtaB
MPQLPRDVIRDRAARLRHAAAEHRTFWLGSRVGGVATMLVERDGVTGHAEDFAKIRVAEPGEPGALRAVRIIGLEDDHLVGVAA